MEALQKCSFVQNRQIAKETFYRKKDSFSNMRSTCKVAQVKGGFILSVCGALGYLQTETHTGVYHAVLGVYPHNV